MGRYVEKDLKIAFEHLLMEHANLKVRDGTSKDEEAGRIYRLR